MRRTLRVAIVLGLVLMAGCRERADRADPPPSMDPIGTAEVPAVVPESPGSAPVAIADPPTTAARDTVRGIIQVVGNEPASVVVLTTGTAEVGALVSLAGASLPLLRGLAGLELMVAGRRTARVDYAAAPAGAPVFEVDQFRVRAVDGVAALDGVLERDGDRHYLRMIDGVRRAIAALPTTLAAQVGARIYLAGPLDRSPTAYGVIRAP